MMRARDFARLVKDWERLLQTQELFRKVIYTPAELAQMDCYGEVSIGTLMQMLVKKGVLVRYAQSRYGLPGLRLEDLVQSMDETAYVTGQFALYRHGIVSRQPDSCTCFTLRHHYQTHVKTAFGDIEFHAIDEPIYFAPDLRVLVASTSQAVCDFVYLRCKQGKTQDIKLENPERINPSRIFAHIRRYPTEEEQELRQILGEIAVIEERSQSCMN